jgi:hypothetical protein
MGYATYANVEGYTGLTFTAAEQTIVNDLCNDASAWMDLLTGGSLSGQSTYLLRMICCKLVAEVWKRRPQYAEYAGAKSLKIGSFSVSFDDIAKEDPSIKSTLEKIALDEECAEGFEVVQLDLSDL